MAKDKVKEIKDWLEKTKPSVSGGIRLRGRARGFVDWLITALKQARAENLKLIKANGEVAILHIEAEAEIKRLHGNLNKYTAAAEARIRELEAEL